MPKSRAESLRDGVASRDPKETFSTAALVDAAEASESWHYSLFRKCRTFDEVKMLADKQDLQATNEFGLIRLSRKGRFVGSFWLFD